MKILPIFIVFIMSVSTTGYSQSFYKGKINNRMVFGDDSTFNSSMGTQKNSNLSNQVANLSESLQVKVSDFIKEDTVQCFYANSCSGNRPVGCPLSYKASSLSRVELSDLHLGNNITIPGSSLVSENGLCANLESKYCEHYAGEKFENVVWLRQTDAKLLGIDKLKKITFQSGRCNQNTAH